ncbi:hypothetical protein DACRYDRAFT_77446 [Dacryopinax primogenitus]|uniref:DUF3533 domain-containing protein n=1 Tax=Dacryopinax primogenitus (strain DJM 731) TaxID=1858805 RepID=M5GF05_DACPD|nr:uncharacterized protein DACRYDRAFT_77446 [Dacryopinax primogenitus]EJU03718.1 hypothetical protein DACRYDRAFT_77446 [Dacryopinax primogenitus]
MTSNGTSESPKLLRRSTTVHSTPAFNPQSPPKPRRLHLLPPPSHHGPAATNPYGTNQHGIQKYHHGFFDPSLAPLRAAYMKIMGMMTIVIVLILWACLPLYWGSFWLELTHSPGLNAWVVNRDPNGLIGQFVTQAMVNSSHGMWDPIPEGHLGWQVVSPSQAGSDQDIEDAVAVHETVWVVLVIQENATAILEEARANGDPSYDPTKVLTWYFSEARNEIATDTIIQELIDYILGLTSARLNTLLAAEYLQQIQGNVTALANLAQAPQTISGPVSITMVNLRPYTDPTALAVELVGSIYLIIVAFIWSNGHAQARMLISPHLRTRSYLILRIVAPLISYLPLSLAFSMISLPFKLPFDGKYSYAGGFFLYWCYCYLAMCALGLAIEAMITLLTPRFAFLFLIPWIITNVSVAQTPFELGAWFYRYGYGFPVFNLAQAVRTILFNTRNALGLNAAVLLSWAGLSLITMPTFTLLMRSLEMRKARKEIREANVARKENVDVDVGYEGGGTLAQEDTASDSDVVERGGKVANGGSLTGV